VLCDWSNFPWAKLNRMRKKDQLKTLEKRTTEEKRKLKKTNKKATKTKRKIKERKTKKDYCMFSMSLMFHDENEAFKDALKSI